MSSHHHPDRLVLRANASCVAEQATSHHHQDQKVLRANDVLCRAANTRPHLNGHHPDRLVLRANDVLCRAANKTKAKQEKK